jgi:hypothetical protein
MAKSSYLAGLLSLSGVHSIKPSYYLIFLIIQDIMQANSNKGVCTTFRIFDLLTRAGKYQSGVVCVPESIILESRSNVAPYSKNTNKYEYKVGIL